jgi:response regulator RpfG family c-di-GMP phosphodiesterase
MILSKGFATALPSSSAEPVEEMPLPTILIVDDEREITASLADQFQRNFKVLTAASGKEALAILQEQPVSVVIADQRMPGMTGAELLAQSLSIDSDAVRILLTGYSDIDTVIESVNEGKIFFYLTKPWRITEMEAVVTKAVEHNRLLRERKRMVEELRTANAELEKRVTNLTRELGSANRRIAELERI